MSYCKKQKTEMKIVCLVDKFLTNTQTLRSRVKQILINFKLELLSSNIGVLQYFQLKKKINRFEQC